MAGDGIGRAPATADRGVGQVETEEDVAGYVVRRLLVGIPILFLVVTLVFFAFQLIPGDPARMYAGEQASA